MAEDAGSIYSEVRIKLDKLQADISQTVSLIDKLGDDVDKKTGSTSKKATKNIEAVGVASVALGAAVTGAFRSMITTFADFEQSMANVRAVTGASAEEFQQLKAAAEEAGASTRFSASEAADALYYLGSAGFTASQSIDALDGVLQLAQATGADLASTADTVAAAISQFGLDASDSGRIANLFAAANAQSQASMEKLQSSMRQTGPVAGALGISIEETTANLMALYNAGFQGEAAGTALRAILLDLSSQSSTTSKKLADLGITLTDSSGKFIGLTKSVGVLAESGINLGEIFGKEVAAQMLVLAKTGEAALTDMQASITGTTAAAEAAAIQTDTLKGSMDEFASAAENAGNKATESVVPAMRGLLDMGAGMLKFFADLPNPIKAVTVTLTALAAGFALVSGAASVFGVTLTAALGPVGLAVAGIAAGVVAIGVGISAAQEDASKANARLIQQNNDLIKGYKDTRKAIDEMFASTDELNRSNKLTEEQIAALIRDYPELTKKIDLNTVSVQDAIKAAKELNKQKANETLTNIRREIVDTQVKINNDKIRLQAEKDNLQKSLAAQKESIERKLAYYERDGKARDNLSNGQRRAYEDLKKQLANVDSANTTVILKIQAEIKEREKLRGELEKNRDALIDEINGTAAAREADTKEKELAAKKDAAIAEERRRMAAEEKQQADEKKKRLAELMAKIRQSTETEVQQLERQRDEALKTAKENGASQKDLAEITQIYQDQIAQAYSDGARAQAEINDRSIEDIKKAEQEKKNAVINAELAKAAIRADSAAREKALREKAEKEAIESTKKTLEEVATITNAAVGALTGLFDALAKLSAAQSESAIADLKEQMQLELEAAGLADKTAVEQAQLELEEAKKTGDAQVILDAENALKRAQIEEDYNRKIAQAEYDAAVTAWEWQKVNAVISGSQAALNAVVSAFQLPAPLAVPAAVALGGFAAAQTAVTLAAIEESKPRPPRLATGGIVMPQPGGVPVVAAENGYPELALNGGPSGQAFLNKFADAMVARMGAVGGSGRPIIIQFDGRTVAEIAAQYYNNGNVTLRLK